MLYIGARTSETSSYENEGGKTTEELEPISVIPLRNRHSTTYLVDIRSLNAK